MLHQLQVNLFPLNDHFLSIISINSIFLFILFYHLYFVIMKSFNHHNLLMFSIFLLIYLELDK